MLDNDIIQYNKRVYESDWEDGIKEFGYRQYWNLKSYKSVDYYAAEAHRLAILLITYYAVDSQSPLFSVLPMVTQLITELANEALKREDNIAYGEIDENYQRYETWLANGRMYAYESLAFAYWFHDKEPSPELWMTAAEQTERYLVCSRMKSEILKYCLDSLFMSSNYRLVINYYSKYKKNKIDISHFQNGQIIKNYVNYIYLAAMYFEENFPDHLTKTIVRSTSYFYKLSLDWRVRRMIFLTRKQRIVLAFIRGKLITNCTDPSLLAHDIRGF